MTARKIVLIVALVLPSVALVAIPGSASASPKPTGTGTLTCSVGGGVTFNPPLTEFGTPPGPGARKDVANVFLQLTDCSGPDSNTPQPNPTATTVGGRTYLKNTTIEFMGHMMKVVGGCSFSGFDPEARTGNYAEWTGGSPVSRTHTILHVDTVGGDVTGTSTGSYPGLVSGTLNLTAESADEYNTVCGNGSGEGSISSLQFDALTSTMTIGEPAP